jgi:hypothetical protein
MGHGGGQASAAERLRAIDSHLSQASGQAPPTATADDSASSEEAPGLTLAEREHFHSQGFLVIRGAAPREACTEACAEAFALAGKDPHDRHTWYRPQPAGRTRSGTRHPAHADRWQADLEASMIRAEHSPAAWRIRTAPRMHQCFSALWGTERLWLNGTESPEAARPLFNLKPPVADAHPGWGGGTYLHWDASVEPGSAPPLHGGLQIQGVLYLADTPVNGGGIRVAAGFHRMLEDDPQLAQRWHEIRQRAPDNGPDGCMDLAELSGLPVTQLAARAGDLIVWNSLLPHGTGKNTAAEPRRAMFVSMTPVDRVVAEAPAGQAYSTLRAQREAAWRGDCHEAGLSQLGRRLIGLEDW